MLTIPLYFLLFAYFAYLLFFAMFVLLNFSHLVHTGALTFQSFVVTLFFFALSTIIIWATWYVLQDVNWQSPIIHWSFSNLNSFTLPGNGGI